MNCMPNLINTYPIQYTIKSEFSFFQSIILEKRILIENNKTFTV